MHTLSVSGGLRSVTRTAIHRLGGELVVRMFISKISVATDTGIGAMRREREFGGIHEQGNLAAGGRGFGERVVRVTIQTLAVRGGRPKRECQGAAQTNPQYPTPEHSAPDTHHP
jgi:hypothetical protein